MSQKSSLFDKRTTGIVALLILLWGITMGTIWYTRHGTAEGAGSWSAEDQRTLGNKLRSVGLVGEAIDQYEQYLSLSSVPSSSGAAMSYLIGTLYMDQGSYEKALTWLYRSEIQDPEHTVNGERASKIVHCLERLERFSAAQYALDARAGLSDGASHGDEAAVSSRIVARIGDEEISRSELDESFDRLSPWLKERFDSPDKKEEYLRQYVAEELLWRKARELELDKDPAIRTMVEDAERKIVVEALIKEELQDKIVMDENDLKNFFLANQKAYEQKQRAKISLIKSGMIEAARKLYEKLEAGEDFSALAEEFSIHEDTAERGGACRDWVVDGEDTLGIGYVDKVCEAVFSLSEGEISDIVEIGDAYYIFRLDDYQPARERSFEEVQKEVAADYYARKLSSAYEKLLDQVLRTEEVTLYPEQLSK